MWAPRAPVAPVKIWRVNCGRRNLKESTYNNASGREGFIRCGNRGKLGYHSSHFIKSGFIDGCVFYILAFVWPTKKFNKSTSPLAFTPLP